MKTFSEILPQFLAHISIKVREKSYRSYLGKTKVFSDWLNSHGQSGICISRITNQTIADFFAWLATEKDLDRPTCQQYYHTIRKVFDYAQRCGEVKEIPFDLVVFPPKKEDMGAQVIDKDHARALLTEIKKHDKQLYVACMMEYYCFTRPGRELRLLKVKDIDTSNWTVKISSEHAKNGHKRIVTVPNQMIAILKDYGIEKADKEHYVFGVTKRPGLKPISINMLGYRFRKYRDKLGLPSVYKLYSFKHSGATTLHESGTVSLKSISEHLGHRNLSSTQSYIQGHVGMINQKIRDGFPSPV